MQPNQQTPPAPPPFQPGGNASKGYEFLNPAKPAKRSLLPGGGSKKGRIITVAIGAALLLVIGLFLVSLFASAGKATSQDVLKAVQQQQELIRISTLGVEKARESDTLNLAVNTKLTMESDKAEMLAVAKDHGFKKIDNKLLGQGRNGQTDQKLTQADQANRFDEVFAAELQAQLAAYQQTLKRILDGTAKKHKPVIEKHLRHVSLLAPAKPGN